MKAWHLKRKAEHFYQQAKEEKYRARSAYKLLEINKKFHLIKGDSVVVDLGAAPGSWSQVALQFVGQRGFVLAVDILLMEHLEGPFEFLKADLTKPDTIKKIKEILPGSADLVMSDAAPEFSGIRTRDIGLAMELNKSALAIARRLLKPEGNFVCKAFQGPDFQAFLKDARKNFRVVKTFKPDSSLKSSAEMYVIAKFFSPDSS